MAKRKTGGGGRAKANVGCRYRLEPTPAQHEVLWGFGHTRRYLYNACIAAWILAIDLRVRPDASRVVIDELRECFDWVRSFPPREPTRSCGTWREPQTSDS